MLTRSQERKRDELVRRLLCTDQRIDVFIDKERLYEQRTEASVFVGRYIGKNGPAAMKFDPFRFQQDLEDAVKEAE